MMKKKIKNLTLPGPRPHRPEALTTGQRIAWLLLGFLLGALVIQLTAGKEINRLYYEKVRLQADLYDTIGRLKQYEKDWEAHRYSSIQEIRVEFSPSNRENPEDFLLLSLEKEVKEITRDLIGQEISRASPDLAYRLLDNRIVRLEGKQFLLNVRTLIIAQELCYYLEVEQLPEDVSI